MTEPEVSALLARRGEVLRDDLTDLRSSLLGRERCNGMHSSPTLKFPCFLAEAGRGATECMTDLAAQAFPPPSPEEGAH